jgi:hypothetical protein
MDEIPTNTTPETQQVKTDGKPTCELCGRERSLKNLRPPWKKGTVPNPKGHPKGLSNFTARCNRLFKHIPPEEIKKKILAQFPELEKKKDLTNEDIVAYRFLSAAMQGDPWAIQEWWNRREGKAQEHIDHTTKDKEIKQNIFNVISIDQQKDIEDIQKKTDEI